LGRDSVPLVYISWSTSSSATSTSGAEASSCADQASTASQPAGTAPTTTCSS
jgi:hypothetical protein